jgi:hypothetical protein
LRFERRCSVRQALARGAPSVRHAQRFNLFVDSESRKKAECVASLQPVSFNIDSLSP